MGTSAAKIRILMTGGPASLDRALPASPVGRFAGVFVALRNQFGTLPRHINFAPLSGQFQTVQVIERLLDRRQLELPVGRSS
jgi:hypothetical protein